VQIDVPNKFALVRTHPFTGQPDVLSVMGNAYEPIQNLDNADVLNEIVGRSGALFETAGALNGGRQVFVSMKAPEGLMIGGHDAVDLYLVATNSHDGSSAFKIAATPIRVVCANTLALGLSSAKASYSIRHTSGAKTRIAEAQAALGVMWNYAEEFEAEANRMLDTKVTDAQFAKIVAGLFPEKRDESERMTRTREQAVANVTFLHREAPTQDGIRGTAWGAWNAITEYVDWAWPVKGDENARAERIAAGGWTTTIKQNAYAALSRV
jgi:phage/plasmid-like protein (TIGR03299 family)